MRTSETAALLRTMIKHQIAITPCLWGLTGIGKSSIPKQVAREFGYRVFDIRLSQLESVDLKGMPFTHFMNVELSKAELIQEIERMKAFAKKKTKMMELIKDAEVLKGMTKDNVEDYYKFLPEYSDHQVGTLHHYSPDWFMTALTEGKCIIFLDELNRARQDVLQAAFELVLDRTINNQKLPDSVFILTACNPATANYDTNSLEDDALKARFMHIQVKSNTEDWLDWAGQYVDEEKSKKRIHPNVLTYVIESPSELNFKKDGDDDSLETWIGDIHPVPRRWELVSILENHANEIDDKILAECINGLVGTKVGVKYWQTRKTSDRPIPLKDLLAWSDETKKKVARYSGNSGVTGAEAKTRGAKKAESSTIRMDLINETVKDILGNWKMVIKSDQKGLLEFISMIPKDSTTKVLKDLLMNEPTLSNNDPEFKKDFEKFLKAVSKDEEVIKALTRLKEMETK